MGSYQSAEGKFVVMPQKVAGGNSENAFQKLCFKVI